MIDRSVRDMHLRADTVRAADSNHIVGSHGEVGSPPLGSFAIDGVNGARLAEVVDLWGLSQFPRAPGVAIVGWRREHGADTIQRAREKSSG